MIQYGAGVALLRLLRLSRAVLNKSRSLLATGIAQALCKHFGEGSRVQHNVWLQDLKQISFGTNCIICSGSIVVSESENGFMDIGDDVSINMNVRIDYTGGLKVGRNVVISESAVVYTHSHGFDPHSPPRGFYKEIGDLAWIGARAIVLPQCQRIGKGSVIAAGAIVSSDVPPNSVVAGNPARVIRTLQ